MKIAVVGSPDWSDAGRLGNVLAKLTKKGDVILVKGYAKGAGKLAQAWALNGDKANWREVNVFYQRDGDKGIDAQIYQEAMMLAEADAVVCFGPPGRFVAKAKAAKKKVKVVQ